MYTKCNRVTIPQAWPGVSSVAALTACHSTCVRVNPHVYASSITLYRGYSAQYSSYAGTPILITVSYFIIINYCYYDVDYDIVDARP